MPSEDGIQETKGMQIIEVRNL